MRRNASRIEELKFVRDKLTINDVTEFCEFLKAKYAEKAPQNAACELGKLYLFAVQSNTKKVTQKITQTFCDGYSR